MKICAACRQPLDGNPRDHDCPEDAETEDNRGDDAA